MFISQLCFTEVETEALGGELADPGPLWVLDSRVFLLDRSRRQLGPGQNYIEVMLPLPKEPAFSSFQSCQGTKDLKGTRGLRS